MSNTEDEKLGGDSEKIDPLLGTVNDIVGESVVDPATIELPPLGQPAGIEGQQPPHPIITLTELIGETAIETREAGLHLENYTGTKCSKVAAQIRRGLSNPARVGEIERLIGPSSAPSRLSSRPPSSSSGISAQELQFQKQNLANLQEEPKNGFDSAEQFLRYTLLTNDTLSEQRAMYLHNSAKYHLEDPEVPGKKCTSVLFECADGRNSPLLFLKEDEILKRYATRWLPSAGLILFPELKGQRSRKQFEDLFAADPQAKDLVFKRLDFHLGAKVKNFFKRKASSDEFSRLLIEFQSHYQSKGFPEHGCGAHCSNFNNAQAETIKDAILTDMWLKETYPEQYADGQFRVFRSSHDTGDKGNVYDGTLLDETLVDREFREANAEMFEDAKKFSAPVIKGLPAGTLREYQQNHLEINVEHHNEQIIRVSDTHFAHTLLGQSVLEVVWTNQPQNLFDHIKVLLGIIDGNFRKGGTNPKPAIIHFDLIEHRPDITVVYKQVMSMINSDPVLSQRLADGTLQIVSTQTNSDDYLSFPLSPAA